jgi:hypothetical protein
MTNSTKKRKSFIHVWSDLVQKYLPFIYLFSVCIGALFTWYKYFLVGINVFNYANVYDFLMMPFRDKWALFFTVFPLVIIWSYLKVFSMLINNPQSFWGRLLYEPYKKRFPKYAKKEEDLLGSDFGILLYFVPYLILSLLFYGKMTQIMVHTPVITCEFTDGTKLRGMRIGQLSDYVFLNLGSKIEAIPLGNEVKKIVVAEFDRDDFDVDNWKKEHQIWTDEEASKGRQLWDKIQKFMSN